MACNYFITGGTGTLGSETVKQLLLLPDTEKITIFSRDELKQKKMRNQFKDNRLHFVIGDVKDYESLKMAFHGKIDYVFHFAALKHIDVCEENPSECIKTNFYGTQNIVNLVIEKDIKKLIFSSTDKAINPINIYGMSKLMAEKMIRNIDAQDSCNRFLIFRWGNVLGSRGSLLDIIKKSLLDSNEILLARCHDENEKVTRFFVLIQDAVEFMIACKDQYNVNDCLVPPMKGAQIDRLVAITAEMLKIVCYSLNYYRLPVIEKSHEEIRFAPWKEVVSSKDVPQYTDEELTSMIKRCL
jgi:UDP-N-acetylglucosamine 4,6-dehydratase